MATRVRPSDFSITRSIRIGASPSGVFEPINNLRQWEKWNLNGADDPTIHRTYGGRPSGAGATMTWSGRRSGAGDIEIKSAKPDEEVVVLVRFSRPFQVSNVNTFVLTPDADGTQLTWSMHGPKPLLAKIMSVVFDMDKQLGRHFEAGLANLKSIAEGVR